MSKSKTNGSRIENNNSMIRTYESTKNSTNNEHDQLKCPAPERYLGQTFRDASSSTQNTPCTNINIIVRFVLSLKCNCLDN